jgi:hypothetical protein
LSEAAHKPRNAVTIKSKLTRLENRLGVAYCPHCRGAILPRGAEHGPVHFTEDVKRQIMARALARFNTRETLLDVLATLSPAQRMSVADVYPLRPGEQLGEAPRGV